MTLTTELEAFTWAQSKPAFCTDHLLEYHTWKHRCGLDHPGEAKGWACMRPAGHVGVHESVGHTGPKQLKAVRRWYTHL